MKANTQKPKLLRNFRAFWVLRPWIEHMYLILLLPEISLKLKGFFLIFFLRSKPIGMERMGKNQ